MFFLFLLRIFYLFVFLLFFWGCGKGVFFLLWFLLRICFFGGVDGKQRLVTFVDFKLFCVFCFVVVLFLVCFFGLFCSVCFEFDGFTNGLVATDGFVLLLGLLSFLSFWGGGLFNIWPY